MNDFTILVMGFDHCSLCAVVNPFMYRRPWIGRKAPNLRPNATRRNFDNGSTSVR